MSLCFGYTQGKKSRRIGGRPSRRTIYEVRQRLIRTVRHTVRVVRLSYESPTRFRSHHSISYKEYIRVARRETLVFAVHQEVKVFQDQGAD